MRHHSKELPRINVPDAVKKCLTQATADGKSPARTKQLEWGLNALAAETNMPVSELTPGWVSRYITDMTASERTKKNARDVISYFGRWLVLHGYLTRGTDLVEGVERYSMKPGEIHIFSPRELSLLLEHASDKLGLLFSLKTHRTEFSGEAGGHDEKVWSIRVALPILAGVTVLIALVSEIFIESVQEASVELGMNTALVGSIVVALVGAAAEMTAAFAAARKNRLDLSVSIALGSASQIALFVAPLMLFLSYAMAPVPMYLVFWPGAVLMVLVATLTATMVTVGGKSAWFVGAILLAVYLVFASTLYLLPPRTP